MIVFLKHCKCEHIIIVLRIRGMWQYFLCCCMCGIYDSQPLAVSSLWWISCYIWIPFNHTADLNTMSKIHTLISITIPLKCSKSCNRPKEHTSPKIRTIKMNNSRAITCPLLCLKYFTTAQIFTLQLLNCIFSCFKSKRQIKGQFFLFSDLKCYCSTLLRCKLWKASFPLLNLRESDDTCVGVHQVPKNQQ